LLRVGPLALLARDLEQGREALKLLMREEDAEPLAEHGIFRRRDRADKALRLGRPHRLRSYGMATAKIGSRPTARPRSHGRVALRIAIGNEQTTLDDVQAAWDLLQRAAFARLPLSAR